MTTLALPVPFDRAPARTQAARVTVHGRRWCAFSKLARRELDRLGVPYEYVDLDEHPDVARRLARMAGRPVYTPVVEIGDELLIQPSQRELRRSVVSE